jgi:hypothetical protein
MRLSANDDDPVALHTAVEASPFKLLEHPSIVMDMPNTGDHLRAR